MTAEPTDLTEARSALHGAGLRATGARIAVWQALRAAARPISHADVSDAIGPSPWDRTTLYRNLSDLVEAGLVRRSELGDRVWRFELVTPAAEAHHHAHFVCTECGTVECLPNVEVAVTPAAKLPRAVRAQHFELQVRGLCDDCEPET